MLADAPREVREAVRRFQAMDAAFKAGDLAALRLAVEDPAAIPNGPLPLGFGSCLTYAISHSPLAFVSELLDLGADVDGPSGDGFPPIIAVLSCLRDEPGAPRRSDADAMLRALLGAGANPNRRGIHDYTPLHMAVAAGSGLAVMRLLEAGADPELRTRIDDCETPREMAVRAGRLDLAALIDCRGRPPARLLRPGLTLVWDVPGTGRQPERHEDCRMRLRMWLPDGSPVRWADPDAPAGRAGTHDELATAIRFCRGTMIPGLFYGVDGMRVGGTRRLQLAPGMAYGERGVPGSVPPGASLEVELSLLDAADGV